jgi:O-antigen ligase
MILYFFEKYKNKFIYLLLLSLTLPILFVCFDTLYQFFSGRDIFGYPKLEHRLSGPFGDELIVGAYLARLSPLLIILYFITFKNFPLKIIILFSMISPLIFITGERTSFFLFNFFLVFFLLFSIKKNKFKIFFSIFSIIAFFLTITLLFNSKLRDRMIHIPACEMRIFFLANDNCKSEYIEKQNISDKKIKNYYIFSAAHEGHFKTALNIFFDNKFFGSGVKMFRVKCSDPKYYEKFGCTTHPHNLLMQILAETGLVGLLFLITAISYICTKSFKIILLIFLGKNKYFHIIQLLLLIMMLQSFFILLPSGQFFNNWNAIVIYSPLGIYLKYAYYT